MKKNATTPVPMVDGSDWHKMQCDAEAEKGYTRLPPEQWGDSMNRATARSHQQLAADDFKEPDVSEGVSFRQRI